MTTYLLNTNIWLRSVQPESPHYRLATMATAQLLTQRHDIVLTAQNIIEFWSVATRSVTANGLGWSVDIADREVARLLTQFSFCSDTADVFVHWRQLVTTHRVGGRRVHDVRLVAVMLAHGITHLLTFNDADFRSFPMITVVTPQDVMELQEVSNDRTGAI